MAIKDYKPIDSVLPAFEKAKRFQKDLNAVVNYIDPQEQIKQVQTKTAKHPLFGVPIVLKDLVNMKDTLTTGSSRILENYVSPYDATITKKLKEAGAIIIAKASCDTFGMGGTNMTAATGPVCNPYDLKRMSGGSSGGSAVLVASGVVPMAIGSDTGDSVRKPASYNNIVGFKPSYGRISRYGVIPYASSLDHVAYFTQNVMDAASTLEVLAGRDDHDMTSSYKEVEAYASSLKGDLKGKKIGILENVVKSIHIEETKALFTALCETCKAQGAEIISISLNDDLMHAFLPTYYIIANAESTANHSNLDGLRFGLAQEGNDIEEVMTNSRTSGFGPLLRKRFVIGSYALFIENQEKIFRKAQKVRRLIVNDLNEAFTKVDVLIAPASAQGAPIMGDASLDQLSSEYLIAENFMALANFAGTPSITIPMGFVHGLPVGLNLNAKAFEEAKLLDIAYGFEKITGLHDQVKEPQ